MGFRQVEKQSKFISLIEPKWIPWALSFLEESISSSNPVGWTGPEIQGPDMDISCPIRIIIIFENQIKEVSVERILPPPPLWVSHLFWHGKENGETSYGWLLESSETSCLITIIMITIWEPCWCTRFNGKLYPKRRKKTKQRAAIVVRRRRDFNYFWPTISQSCLGFLAWSRNDRLLLSDVWGRKWKVGSLEWKRRRRMGQLKNAKINFVDTWRI